MYKQKRSHRPTIHRSDYLDYWATNVRKSERARNVRGGINDDRLERAYGRINYVASKLPQFSLTSSGTFEFNFRSLAPMHCSRRYTEDTRYV
jgi:hypothetical protein